MVLHSLEMSVLDVSDSGGNMPFSPLSLAPLLLLSLGQGEKREGKRVRQSVREEGTRLPFPPSFPPPQSIFTALFQD